MKFDIPVKEIMKTKFTIVPVSEKLTDCVKKMQKQNVCLVIDRGDFIGIVSQKEILNGFLRGKEKVKSILRDTDIGIIDSDSDLIDLFKLMNREKIDFVIVKNRGNIVGIVTKKEITKIEPVLFEIIQKKVENYLEQITLTT
jgi:predicted transcriptional regulator